MLTISKGRIGISFLLIVVAFFAMSTGFLGRPVEDNSITFSSIILGPIMPFGPIVGAIFLFMDYKAPLSIASYVLPYASYIFLPELVLNLTYIYLLSGLILSAFRKTKFQVAATVVIILLAITGLISGIYTDKYTFIYWHEKEIKLQSLSTKHPDTIRDLDQAEHMIIRQRYDTAKLSCDQIKEDEVFNSGRSIKEYCYSEVKAKKILSKEFFTSQLK
jgi:hypothetical protein